MAYFITCPYCGAHLDPGEKCDCMSGRPAGSADLEEAQEPGPAPGAA